MTKKVARWLSEFCGKLTRKKVIGGDIMETPLKRYFGTWDLTLFGIGQMIGGGIYVLSGTVAREIAGPAIVLAMLLAGVVAMLSSLCYAEFAARIPKTGSAYLFGYVTMGEFVAFVIAWQMVLENMIGAAAVGRAWGGYVDSLTGHVIKNGTIAVVGQMRGASSEWLGEYPDFVAFGVVILACVAVAMGVKHSAWLNNLFTLVNLLVILFVIIFGFTLADGANWTEAGNGVGFFPYGFNGVLRGAAVCFFAFIGFDMIATAGEETINPQKSIPIATLASMSVVTVSYVGVAAALTLMVPFKQIDIDAALPDAFAQHNLNWAKYLVAIGALTGMTTSLVGSIFALSRCIYAMSIDGLFFEWFSHLHPKTQIPLNATIVFGVISAVFALVMELKILVEFLSVGTLLAFTIVAASLIVLHYQPLETPSTDDKNYGSITPTEENAESVSRPASPTVAQQRDALAGTLKPQFKFLKFLDGYKPGNVVVFAVVMLAVFTGAFCSTLIHGIEEVKRGRAWIIILASVFGVGIVLSFSLILVHKKNHPQISFKVPFIPFTPALSIFCNVILMTNLTTLTWIRFTIWCAVGFIIYFSYGIRHSKENKLMDYNTMVVFGSDADSDAVSLDGKIIRPQPESVQTASHISTISSPVTPGTSTPKNHSPH